MEGREIRRSRRGASGQGPRGIAEGVSLLSEERGAAPPAGDHPVRPKTPAFYGVLCSSHFFSFFGSCGSRWVNMGQHRPQDGPTWANIAPRWASIAPRWANIFPRSANIAPRWAHIALKIGQHSPKMGQHSPKIGRRPSKYHAFYSVFLLFPFFGSFGSTWVNMRPT